MTVSTPAEIPVMAKAPAGLRSAQRVAKKTDIENDHITREQSGRAPNNGMRLGFARAKVDSSSALNGEEIKTDLSIQSTSTSIGVAVNTNGFRFSSSVVIWDSTVHLRQPPVSVRGQ